MHATAGGPAPGAAQSRPSASSAHPGGSVPFAACSARMRLHVDQCAVHRRREPAGPFRAERTAPGDQAHRRYSLASTAIEVSVVRIGRIIASWVNEAISSPSSVCTVPRM